MKYNVGDRVRIKSIDWYNENKTMFGDVPCGEYDFVSHMSVFCGKILTIDVNFEDETYLMKEDTDGFVFTSEMIECKVEDENKPKFKVGDRVITDTNMKGKIIEVVEEGWYRVEFEPYNGMHQPNGVVPEEHMSLVEEEMSLDEAGQITDFEYEGLAYTLPDGYQFVDENGNKILTNKIILEKKHNDKLKLESTKTVREYWSEYARIYIEIYEDEPNECVLTHLYTLESHRQKGYGRQALIEAESIAKELGCHTTYLKVETDSWMHQWYLRMGYKWYKNANKEYTWLTKSI